MRTATGLIQRRLRGGLTVAVLTWLFACVPYAKAEEAPTADGRSPLTMSDAREALLTGAYEEAIDAFAVLAEDETSRLDATIGLSIALARTGRYEAALARLDELGEIGGRHATWHLARAEIRRETGAYAEAIAAAEEARRLNPRDTTARRLLGELYEATGRRDEAIEEYAWFDALLRRVYPASAAALTDSAIAIYRHAILTRRQDASLRTRYVLHDLLQQAYERVDPRNVPARIAAADLLRSKYNFTEAADDYNAVLEINPHLVEAHVGLGLIALEEWDFDTVDDHIAAALQVNDRSPAVHRLRAALRLTERRFEDAAGAAEAALNTNPGDLEALGLLAAAYFRAGNSEAALAAIERADAINARSPVTPHVIGTWLAAGRQFTDAEGYLQRAIDLEPTWADPRTALGLMYMQTGDERAARRVLDDSWRLDPYNAATKHTLDLLDRLERFGRDETRHFTIRSAEDPDAAIRPLAAAYLESIYHEICDTFGGEPADKTIVEIYPDHQAFAVRITARPWLHTVGASTGRVIAIDAPRPGAAGRPFNWARVLRHEFIHTVTLAATENRIPHWLTEGLATWGEGTGLSADWRLMLSMAWRRGRLFDLESIDWGFARPQRWIDRTLAYAQSAWMVAFMVERHDVEIISDLLDAFRARQPQDQAFEIVLRQTPDAFFAAFEDWAGKQIAAWNLPDSPLPDPEALEAEIEKASGLERARLLASLAEVHLDERDLEAAVEAIERALEDISEPDAEMLRVRLAVLLARQVAAREPPDARAYRREAVAVANELLHADPDSLHAAWVLAREAMRRDRHGTALPHLRKLVEGWPADPFAYEALAEIRLARGEHDEAIEALTRLADLREDDPELPGRIAELELEADRPERAIHWLLAAVHIDPYAVATHAQLARLLLDAGRFAEAVEICTVLIRLDPVEAHHHARLALALARLDREEPARESARRAMRLNPDLDMPELAELAAPP